MFAKRSTYPAFNNLTEKFSCLFQKTSFDISCKLSPQNGLDKEYSDFYYFYMGPIDLQFKISDQRHWCLSLSFQYRLYFSGL